MIGETLGSYKIVRKLGEGGMGVVYLAEHTTIGRKAAVKLLLPTFSHHQEIVTRFFNEARATSLIDHPGLINVYDFGYHASGSAYIVMEFIAGDSLAAQIQRDTTIHPDLLIAISRQVAGALGAAHDKGIVHRDLKPDNVMLVADRDIAGGYRAKVLDFGIAKLAGDAGSPGSQLTHTGAVMGTPAFMSPEQCRSAGEVDARSDIYALGCMMFMMATGRPPFLGEGAGDMIVAHMRDPAPSPRVFNPAVSPALERIILRALAKETSDRQQTMEELITELDAVPAAGFARPPTSDRPFVQSAPPSSTTLGASAGQWAAAPVSPPGRRRALWLGAIGVAVVGAAVTVTLIATGGSSNRAAPSGSSAAAPTATPSLDAAVAPAITPDAGPAATAVVAPPVAPAIDAGAAITPPPVVPEPALPSKVKVTISSTPPGAVVFDGSGRRRGVTPLRLEIDRTGGARRYEVRCLGYRNARVDVSPTKPRAAAKLSRDTSVPPSSDCD